MTFLRCCIMELEDVDQQDLDFKLEREREKSRQDEKTKGQTYKANKKIKFCCKHDNKKKNEIAYVEKKRGNIFVHYKCITSMSSKNLAQSITKISKNSKKDYI